MDKIRKKELRYLIATDIAARGIDISELELVINFSIHQQSESYVHRTGRTGRAGKEGTALSLVSPHDFLGFQAVKELDIELNKVELPTDAEVAAAQIKHLEENLPKKISDRDLIVAKEILKNKSGEELETFIAGLAAYNLEHLVSEEAVSLDEELNKESKDKPKHSAKPYQKSGSYKKSYSKGNKKK